MTLSNEPTNKTEVKPDIRNVVNYYELPEDWQKEAVRNLDDMAEESSYLEPLEDNNPTDHILWDLSECMPLDPNQHGGYNGVIGISNNSAMLLKFDDNMETAEIKII